MAILLGFVLAYGVLSRERLFKPLRPLKPMPALDDRLQSGVSNAMIQKPEVEQPPKVRELEPAEETIFPHDLDSTPEKATEIEEEGEDDPTVS